MVFRPPQRVGTDIVSWALRALSRRYRRLGMCPEDAAKVAWDRVFDDVPYTSAELAIIEDRYVPFDTKAQR